MSKLTVAVVDNVADGEEGADIVDSRAEDDGDDAEENEDEDEDEDGDEDEAEEEGPRAEDTFGPGNSGKRFTRSKILHMSFGDCPARRHSRALANPTSGGGDPTPPLLPARGVDGPGACPTTSPWHGPLPLSKPAARQSTRSSMLPLPLRPTLAQ